MGYIKGVAYRVLHNKTSTRHIANKVAYVYRIGACGKVTYAASTHCARSTSTRIRMHSRHPSSIPIQKMCNVYLATTQDGKYIGYCTVGSFKGPHERALTTGSPIQAHNVTWIYTLKEYETLLKTTYKLSRQKIKSVTSKLSSTENLESNHKDPTMHAVFKRVGTLQSTHYFETEKPLVLHKRLFPTLAI